MKITDMLFSRGRQSKKTVAAVPAELQQIDGISADKNYWESLKEQKKLCLVINMDNTLIDSIDWCNETTYDRNYFTHSSVFDSFKEGKLIPLFYPLEITIKLRPYLQSFLKDRRSKYHIVLFTKRSPSYLDVINKLLDLDGANNLTMISLQSPKSTHQLKTFLSNQELLVILDNTKKGWQNKYSRNIIKVDPYAYFSRVKMNNPFQKSWTEMKGDECELGGELYRISNLLGGLRNVFYDPRYGDFQDIRQLIPKFQRKNPLNLYGFSPDVSS